MAFETNLSTGFAGGTGMASGTGGKAVLACSWLDLCELLQPATLRPNGTRTMTTYGYANAEEIKATVGHRDRLYAITVVHNWPQELARLRSVAVASDRGRLTKLQRTVIRRADLVRHRRNVQRKQRQGGR